MAGFNSSFLRPLTIRNSSNFSAFARKLLLAATTVVIGLSAAPQEASAYSITITSGSRALYLQVGAGGYTIPSVSGGAPADNAAINVVSVTVPVTIVGSGTPQVMTSNSTAAASPIDGFIFCNPPTEVYISGWARNTNGSGVATLTVQTPANLTSGSDTIPFNQISWVMSGIGDATFGFSNGTFNGGTQTLGSIPANSWTEQCMTFQYANSVVRAAGNYSGRAVYRLALP